MTTAVLPVLPVDDLLERAPVGSFDRLELPVGGIAERDEIGAEPSLGKAEDGAGEVLVLDRGVPAADAQVRRRDHQAHGRLTQVEVKQRPLVLVPWDGSDERHGRGRPGDVTRANDVNRLRSVTTTKSHGCQFLADGDRRAASSTWCRCSRGMVRLVYARTFRLDRMASHVSMRLMLPDGQSRKRQDRPRAARSPRLEPGSWRRRAKVTSG